MPRKERTTRPGAGQLDLSLLGGVEPSPMTEQQAQQRLAATAARLAGDLTDPDAALWADSPYSWVKNLPTARKSKAAERLVASALADLGVVVARASGPGHDFAYAGARIKVRMSMRWAAGEYVFQQTTAGDTDLVCLLGISPQVVHLWVVDKAVLTGQVTSSTGWLTFACTNPPEWLAPYGGTVTAAARLLAARAGQATGPTL